MVGDYPHLRITIDELVVTLAIDRPEAANALSAELVSELHNALDDLGGAPRLLVVTSATPGRFVAGADIAELLARDEEDALRAINVDLFDRIARWRWPTVAAIDGPAIGGGLELAMACDLRVASSRSWFRQPEVGLGIVAGAGAHRRLVDLVGVGRARRMLLAGVRVEASEAYDWGLIDVVDDDPLGSALQLARSMASQSLRALELTKLVLASVERPSTRTADILAQAVLFESDDKRARMGAFLERRRGRGSTDSGPGEPDRR